VGTGIAAGKFPKKSLNLSAAAASEAMSVAMLI
jgi:hypothetical protein